MRITLFALAATLLVAAAAPAQDIINQNLTYRDGDTTLRGYLAVPADLRANDDAPGVLVVHEWWGLNDYARRRADMLARLGYVALAVDMYGDGKTTTDPKEAGQWAGALYQDREALRRRAAAGLKALAQAPNVDPDYLAALGYCFGGTTVLELAYHQGGEKAVPDARLRGVVSFHGNPKPPLDADRTVPPSVLILHGAADPMVAQTEVDAVADAIRQRGGEARVISYEDAKHSFTNPDADKLGMDAVAYQKEADEQSWQELKAFLEKTLDY